MKWNMPLIVGFAVCLTACSEKQQAEPEAEESSIATMSDAPAAESVEWQNEALLAHMHEHADQLDNLNFALADGDLVAAMTPAYWLSRHDEDSAYPARFQPFIAGMREAALAVEMAPDIDAARQAAERITVQCQGCHAAAGIDRVQQ